MVICGMFLTFKNSSGDDNLAEMKEREKKSKSDDFMAWEMKCDA